MLVADLGPSAPGEGHVAGHHDLDPTRQGQAIDGHHHGQGRGLEAAQHGVDMADEFRQHRPVLARRHHFVQIRAGAKGLAGAGQQHHADGVIRLEGIHGRIHIVHKTGGNAVKFVRSVQGYAPDPVDDFVKDVRPAHAHDALLDTQ